MTMVKLYIGEEMKQNFATTLKTILNIKYTTLTPDPTIRGIDVEQKESGLWQAFLVFENEYDAVYFKLTQHDRTTKS